MVCRVGVFPRVRRLAEKYSESQTTKEKIQKSIEVKKEHLSSLQPGLNAIMQVSLPTPPRDTELLFSSNVGGAF